MHHVHDQEDADTQWSLAESIMPDDLKGEKTYMKYIIPSRKSKPDKVMWAI